MKKTIIILTAALTSMSLFSCGTDNSSNSSKSSEKAAIVDSQAAVGLPVIDKAEIVAEYADGADGYMFRIDVEGDLKYWEADVTMTNCGEQEKLSISTKDYDRNSRYITGGSTITDISAVVTPYDAEGNAGKPVSIKWDPERKEKTTIDNLADETIVSANEDVSLDAIVGNWCYELRDAGSEEYIGVPKGYVVVSIDGTYTYNNGSETVRGTVQVDYDEYSDGSKVPFYAFYNDNGDFWIGCYIGQNEPDVFYIGNGGESRLVRDNGNTVIDNDNSSDDVKLQNGDSFVGLWGSGRASLVVEKIANNSFTVYVKWSSSASESTSWTYDICNYSPDSGCLVCEGGGSCSDIVCTEDGKETVTTRYTGSNATFTLDSTGKTLIWSDDKETADDDMEFVFCQ